MVIPRFVARYGCRPRVVHRLPGRLRIHLPILQHVPADERAALTETAEAITEIDGIDQIEANPVSGNLLILYKPERIAEKKVIRMVNDVTALIMDLADETKEQPIAERWATARRMIARLIRNGSHGK